MGHYWSHWWGNSAVPLDLVGGRVPCASQNCALGGQQAWSISSMAHVPYWITVVPGRSGQAAPSELEWRAIFLMAGCGQGDICGWNQRLATGVWDRRQEYVVQNLSMEFLWGRKLLVPNSLSFVLYWTPILCLGTVNIWWFFAEPINEYMNSYTTNIWWVLIVWRPVYFHPLGVNMLLYQVLWFCFGKYGSNIWRIWYLPSDRFWRCKDEWDTIWASFLQSELQTGLG